MMLYKIYKQKLGMVGHLCGGLPACFIFVGSGIETSKHFIEFLTNLSHLPFRSYI